MSSLEQAQGQVGSATPEGTFLAGLKASIGGALNRVAAAFNQANLLRPADAPSASTDPFPIPFFHSNRQTKVVQIAVVPSASVAGTAPDHVNLEFYVLDAAGLAGPIIGTISDFPLPFVQGVARVLNPPVPPVIPVGGSLAYQAKAVGTSALPASFLTAKILSA